MGVLYFVLGLIALLILLCIAYGAIQRGKIRLLVPDQYEWLEVLSHTEWRTRSMLAQRMGARAGRSTELSFYGTIIYDDLQNLLDEKLIEKSEQPVVLPDHKPFDQYFFATSFRLTPLGMRERHTRTKSTTSGNGACTPT